jgi:hypothetical protein
MDFGTKFTLRLWFTAGVRDIFGELWVSLVRVLFYELLRESGAKSRLTSATEQALFTTTSSTESRGPMQPSSIACYPAKQYAFLVALRPTDFALSCPYDCNTLLPEITPRQCFVYLKAECFIIILQVSTPVCHASLRHIVASFDRLEVCFRLLQLLSYLCGTLQHSGRQTFLARSKYW